MKTIICDIDGTLTNIWPIEKSILSRMLPEEKSPLIEMLKRSGASDNYQIFCKIARKSIPKSEFRKIYNATFEVLRYEKVLPILKAFPIVTWILANRQYTYVYATGGQKTETLYALQQLGIEQLFDLVNSVDKSTYPFSKKTGLPFKRILKKYPDCVLFSDSLADCEGAEKVRIPFILIEPEKTSEVSKKINKLLNLV